MFHGPFLERTKQEHLRRRHAGGSTRAGSAGSGPTRSCSTRARPRGQREAPHQLHRTRARAQTPPTPIFEAERIIPRPRRVYDAGIRAQHLIGFLEAAARRGGGAPLTRPTGPRVRATHLDWASSTSSAPPTSQPGTAKEDVQGVATAVAGRRSAGRARPPRRRGCRGRTWQISRRAGGRRRFGRPGLQDTARSPDGQRWMSVSSRFPEATD